MKYSNVVIERMLKETCDCTDKMLEDVKVSEYHPSDYHIQYKEDDPFEGFDFRVKITDIQTENGYVYHFNITESKYADNGDFFLDYHLVAD